jgi:hypothetical protein
MKPSWYWPGPSEVNDIPDPLRIEEKWTPWPGTMEDGPSVFAEIFSREYIQNSWDSIQAKRLTLSKDQSDVKPSLEFRFVELAGDAAKAFAETFGLTDHAARLSEMDEATRNSSRLGAAGELLAKEDFSAIRILVASERLAEGMAGRWDADDRVSTPQSKLRNALVQSVSGKEHQGGTGGSWGEGKKAVAAASRLRTLAAYTCHKAEDNDPDVTRRLLGVTYWRTHEWDGLRQRGLGVLGNPVSESEKYAEFEPLANDDADQFIDALNVPHFNARDPHEVTDHGTTYIFIEPSFSPEELASAIARNWWPLIETQKLEISVHGYDDNPLSIETRANPVLFPFIKAFDIAMGIDKAEPKVELREEISVHGEAAGVVAIISDISQDGWSYDQPDNGNANLIALIRNDMVIAYRPFPLKQRPPAPYVRGTFVVEVDGDSSRILKMTEGHLHNEWVTDAEQVGDEGNANFAKRVLDSLNEQAKKLRNQIKKSDNTGDVRIRAFEQVFAGKGPSLGSSGGPKGEPTGERDFSIQGLSHALKEFDPDDPTRLRFTATARLALKESQPADSLGVSVALGWKVREENGYAVDEALANPKSIALPAGFKLRDGVAVGELTHEPVEFCWTSAFFSSDWQVTPSPVVSKLDASPPTKTEES